MYRILLLYIALFLSTTAFAQPAIVINNEQELISFADKMEIFVDSTNQLGINKILREETLQYFTPNSSGKILSIPSSSTLWGKFTVENRSNREVWIDLASNVLWDFEIYAITNEGEIIQLVNSGLIKPKKYKPKYSSHYIVPILNYNQPQPQTFYVKLFAKVPSIYIPKIGTKETLIPRIRFYDLRVNIYWGLMLVMILYNGFIGLIIKDRIYLYYILYLFYVSLVIPLWSGDSFIHSEWLFDIFPVLSLFGYLVPVLFAFKYLEVYKKAKFFFYLIGVITLILVMMSLFYMVDLLSYKSYSTYSYRVALIYNPSLWLVGVYLWIKGNKNARFYTIAWTSVLSVVIWNFMVLLGIIPYGEYLSNLFYIGFGLETILFSLALGDKLNTLQKEKREAQKENIKLIKEQKETLELKVLERTEELQIKNKELQTMNEELNQSQEEIASQRDSLDKQNVKLNLQQAKIKNSIKVAKSIQKAILPHQEKLDKLLKDYFIINKPKDVVSGDFYWVDKIDNKIIILIADCTGHGVPGAFMTLIGNILLDRVIILRETTSPAEILSALHKEIQLVLRQRENKDYMNGMDGVIFSIEENNNHTFDITFAGAKNELYYFTPEDPRLNILKGERNSIGGQHSFLNSFENQKVTLPKGSILYTGTDGFADQNNYKRRRFSKDQIEEFSSKIRYLSMKEQKAQLEQKLEEHMLNTYQRDDILWVGIKL